LFDRPLSIGWLLIDRWSVLRLSARRAAQEPQEPGPLHSLLVDLRTSLQFELRAANAIASDLERSQAVNHRSLRLLQEISKHVVSLRELHASSHGEILAIDAALTAVIAASRAAPSPSHD